MSSIDTALAIRIRRDILKGIYAEGERLSEAQLCATHGVSRTPIRLALRRLELGGIIARNQGRGYVVRAPTIADILQAVEVRGHLESLAARLMALAPDRHTYLPEMARAIAKYEKLLEPDCITESMICAMQRANRLFHTTILKACGNAYVGYTCQRIAHLPMLAPGSMVFDRSVMASRAQMERGLFRLRLGDAQHRVIFAAIEKGDPVRAEGMMREHAHTMIEYIQTFEKRNRKLTIADLVTCSADQLHIEHE